MTSLARSKVFCIGLNKTGTTTLWQCGQILGFRCVGCRRDLLADLILRRDIRPLLAVAREHEFFSDWPWPLAYRYLDNCFPGSKFILSTRITDRVWLLSLKRHSMNTHPFRNCRKLAYGYHFPHMHGDSHIAFYQRHNDEVREFFKGRPNQFLEVCWERGDDWSKLCNFLDLPVPNVPFPHSNPGSDPPPLRWGSIVNAVLSRTGL